MKRLIAMALVLALMLSFGGCANNENEEKDISQNSAADTTNSQAEQPDDSSAAEESDDSSQAEQPDDSSAAEESDDSSAPEEPDDSSASEESDNDSEGEQTDDSNLSSEAKEVESITNSSIGLSLADALEQFYEDESFIYIFGNPISEYVIVKYTDGSSENVKEALENGHIQISVLDEHGIKYYACHKFVENIIHLNNGDEATALEEFYSDDTYVYFFPTICSNSVIVYFKNGTEQTVKSALADGKIKISDLDWFGIKYYKYKYNKEPI